VLDIIDTAAKLGFKIGSEGYDQAEISDSDFGT
jgi:hypothetical protein